MKKPNHIIVGMSGGVDSSIAAFLLKEQGFRVEGMFMKNWEEDDNETLCPATIDLADAQTVCDQLQIPLHTVNFSNEYWSHVFTHFLAEYQAGRTPNPDILCNKEIKFKAFLDYAKQRGADFIATGHYAQRNDELKLIKGNDPAKDQSYFLYALSEFQLAQTLFPIGHLKKEFVRELAKKIGLKNHAKKDSTGICFIGEKKFKLFLQNYLPAKPGEIHTTDGKTIGNHDGLMFYTLGQRQGLKIGGLKNTKEDAWYVVHKDHEKNFLIVAQGQEHPLLYSKTLIAENVHWINGKPEHFPMDLKAKTRYRQIDQICQIIQLEQNKYKVIFENSQRAITPGQSVVFYQDSICLGGGIIVE